MTPYDGFGARINDHYPIPHHYPVTVSSPDGRTPGSTPGGGTKQT